MEKTDRLFRCRIFIAEALENRGLIQKWDEVRKYVLSSDKPRNPREQGGIATMNGYNEKAYQLRATVIEVSREDLGIGQPHHWYKFW
jgi:hypothetical protein